MKKAILLSCLILFLAPMAWAQEKVEAPVWNVGDKWVFKRADGVSYFQEVAEAKEDLFIVKVGGSKDLNAYDKKTMNIKFLIDEGGKQVEPESTLRNLFDFPIFVGKKWSDTTIHMPTGASTARIRLGKALFKSEFKVEGIEEITTPAGTFRAYKLHFQQSDNVSRSSGWIRYWYSPEVKMWVKREVDKSTYWAAAPWAKDAELISYKLK